MESTEFVHYFEKVPQLLNHFAGVFPVDKIPTQMKKKSFFVCNLDPSTMPGSHWICFIKFVSSECEIFDSLGVNVPYLSNYIHFKEETNFIFNKNAVQASSSVLCGKFVIMFVIERFLNQSMKFCDLLNDIFSKNTFENDNIVNSFCNNL
jgi:hypothetical protein